MADIKTICIIYNFIAPKYATFLFGLNKIDNFKGLKNI
jgi:hypothetical protein